MPDFDMGSDDDDSFSVGVDRQVRDSNRKPIMSRSKPSKSFFGGGAVDRSNNDEDVYNFNIDETERPKKSHSSPISSMQSDTGFNKKSKVAAKKSNVSSENALAKAQNMLRKYDTVKTTIDTAGSNSITGSLNRNAFSLRKPSESFDEDDISLDSNEDNRLESGLGSQVGASTNRSVTNLRSFDESKSLYGSPLLGSFNKDDDDSSVGGLRSFGRFDSVDQMNIHQKLYDFQGAEDDDDDFSMDLSDTNSAGKELKKNPTMISKIQKSESKAPPPVFVVAENIDKELAKYVNKEKTKKSNSSMKSCVLEESRASQISSENYEKYDDSDVEDARDGNKKKKNENHNHNESENVSINISQSYLDINDDDINDQVEMEKKDKEKNYVKVARENKNKNKNEFDNGQNNKKSVEDYKNYDDSYDNDNDRNYSISDDDNDDYNLGIYDEKDENKDEDKDKDEDDAPQKFKVSSFADLGFITGWTDEVTSIIPEISAGSGKQLKYDKIEDKASKDMNNKLKNDESKNNYINDKNKKKIEEDEVDEEYEDEFAEDEGEIYEDVEDDDEPVQQTVSKVEEGITTFSSGDATPHSALTPRTTTAPCITYVSQSTSKITPPSSSPSYSSSTSSFVVPHDRGEDKNRTLSSINVIEAVSDRLRVPPGQSFPSSSVPSKIPFTDTKKMSISSSFSSILLPSNPASSSSTLPNTLTSATTTAIASDNEFLKMSGVDTTTALHTNLNLPFYSLEPALPIPIPIPIQQQFQSQQQSVHHLYSQNHPSTQGNSSLPLQPQLNYPALQVQVPAQCQPQHLPQYQHQSSLGTLQNPYTDLSFTGYPTQGQGQGQGQIPGLGQGQIPGLGQSLGQGQIPGQGQGQIPGLGQGQIPGLGQSLGQGQIPGLGQSLGQGQIPGLGQSLGQGQIPGLGQSLGQGQIPGLGQSLGQGQIPGLGQSLGQGDPLNGYPHQYPYQYPHPMSHTPYFPPGYPLHSSMQLPSPYLQSPYESGYPSPHNPYPRHPYGHPYGNAHSLSYLYPQYASNSLESDSYLQHAHSLPLHNRSGSANSFLASTSRTGGLGPGGLFPLSQSRSNFLESTGRSGLGLSYNLRSSSGSGIYGDRVRESGDPAVQDLIESLREAKEDAQWAKARLSEMISLLNEAKEEERGSRVGGSSSATPAVSPRKSRYPRQVPSNRFSESMHTTDDEGDGNSNSNINRDGQKDGDGDGDGDKYRDRGGRSNESSSDDDDQGSESFIEEGDDAEEQDTEVSSDNQEDVEDEDEDEEYSLDFDETPQKKSQKLKKGREKVKSATKPKNDKKVEKENIENNESLSDRTASDKSKLKNGKEVRNSNSSSSLDKDHSLRSLFRDENSNNQNQNQNKKGDRGDNTRNSNFDSNGRLSNSKSKNDWNAGDKKKNNRSGDPYRDEDIDRRATSRPPAASTSSTTSNLALFDMSNPLLTSQALFRQQLNNLRERMDMTAHSTAPSPFTGWSHKPHTPSPSLIQVKAQFEKSKSHASLRLWEVILQVDDTLSEEEAKRLAERYNIIQ